MSKPAMRISFVSTFSQQWRTVRQLAYRMSSAPTKAIKRRCVEIVESNT